MGVPSEQQEPSQTWSLNQVDVAESSQQGEERHSVDAPSEGEHTKSVNEEDGIDSDDSDWTDPRCTPRRAPPIEDPTFQDIIQQTKSSRIL